MLMSKLDYCNFLLWITLSTALSSQISLHWPQWPPLSRFNPHLVYFPSTPPFFWSGPRLWGPLFLCGFRRCSWAGGGGGQHGSAILSLIQQNSHTVGDAPPTEGGENRWLDETRLTGKHFGRRIDQGGNHPILCFRYLQSHDSVFSTETSEHTLTC